MDMIVAIILASTLIVLPFVWRSDILLVLSLLGFGWVLNDVTGNDLLLYARSGFPVGRDTIENSALIILSFLPALSSIYFTKGKIKQTSKLVLSLGFVPAIFVSSWLLLRISLPYSTAQGLNDTVIDDLVIQNQEYALWTAGIFLLLYLFLGRTRSKEDKKK